MGLYGKDKDYEELVKENIQKARILSSFPKEYYNEVIKLLEKKDTIRKENGFLANIKLNILDKKISKLQKKAQKLLSHNNFENDLKNNSESDIKK